ncbi:MAG TPA: hypothetical protein VMT93_03340 [Gemmatimonadaceae bacterium]|nr:hypothetical protein [Gemmatimonadaceae bacterium]
MSGGGVPAKLTRLDRQALERVLARAAELQAAEGDVEDPGLTDAQLLDIAREVGLSQSSLRQALAEERSRVEAPEARGLVDRLFGAAVARASRTLAGEAGRVMGALDAFMQQEEGLRVKRQLPDRVLWERAHGLTAHLKRTFDVSGRGYHLTRTEEVSATVVPVDAQRTLVRLEASLLQRRSAGIAGGATVVALGAVAGGVLLVLPVFPLLAILPAGAGLAAGWAASRAHRGAVLRAQLALEQVLDRVERNERPRPSLLDAFGPEPRVGLPGLRDR